MLYISFLRVFYADSVQTASSIPQSTFDRSKRSILALTEEGILKLSRTESGMVFANCLSLRTLTKAVFYSICVSIEADQVRQEEIAVFGRSEHMRSISARYVHSYGDGFILYTILTLSLLSDFQTAKI